MTALLKDSIATKIPWCNLCFPFTYRKYENNELTNAACDFVSQYFHSCVCVCVCVGGCHWILHELCVCIMLTWPMDPETKV